MNEKNSETPAIPEEKSEELSFGIIGAGGKVYIRFADGEQMLDDYVVSGLGGIEKIMECASAFAEVSYGDFLRAFYLTQEKQHLNNLNRSFVSNHFDRRF